MSQSSKLTKSFSRVEANTVDIGTVTTDEIIEDTPGSGVTIEDVLLKDATISIDGNKVVDEQQPAVTDAVSGFPVLPGGFLTPVAPAGFVDGATTSTVINGNLTAITTNLLTLDSALRDTIDQLNEALAKLRAHGLIDT